jgi:tetratricopeptide (TPR) repeat protein
LSVADLVNRGASYAKQNDYTEAIVNYQKALAIDSDYIPAQVDLGLVPRLQATQTFVSRNTIEGSSAANRTAKVKQPLTSQKLSNLIRSERTHTTVSRRSVASWVKPIALLNCSAK